MEENEWFDVRPLVELFGFRDLGKLTDKVSDIKDKDTQRLCTLGGEQSVTVVNECGLYEIIFSISKKNLDRYEKAMQFKKWVFSEVLPSIRKNNFYVDENYVSKEQLNDLMEKVKNLIVSKKMLHEITYDMADATTMSFTEASKKLFGKDAKYLKKILMEHGFFDKENNIIIGEAEFKNPKGELEMMRIFTRTNVEKARKEDDIRYCKITNFGYMYLKKYFNAIVLSDFKFQKENIDN